MATSAVRQTGRMEAGEPPHARIDAPVIEIVPSEGWTQLHLQDLWRYRELVYFLAWREVKVRYKQTAIGAAWAILQPLFGMLVFTLFFGRLAKIPSDGLPYAIFSLTAMVPWTFFANGLTQASNSLVGNANLLTKVYFPRLAIPIGTLLAGAVDLLLAFGLLVVFMMWYGILPQWQVLWLPAFVLLAAVTSLGVGLWLAVLNVKYRDVRFIVPFLTQFWMLATPIGYPSSLLNEPWKTLYGLNPMVGVVEGFRWALLGGGTPPGAVTGVSAAVAVVVLVTGMLYFRRMEKTFADRV